jgi:hypothetical protein
VREQHCAREREPQQVEPVAHPLMLPRARVDRSCPCFPHFAS